MSLTKEQAECQRLVRDEAARVKAAADAQASLIAECTADFSLEVKPALKCSDVLQHRTNLLLAAILQKL
jgi:hypothetical protein